MIKDFLGEEYLVQNSAVLGYDVGKAQLAKKRTTRSHKKIDATTDTVIESNSVTPVLSFQTTVQAVNTEHEDEARQAKGEQVLGEHDKPAVCCRSSNAVRKVRTTDSIKPEEELAETKDPDKVAEQDAAPELNVSKELIEAIIILIKKYSF